MSKNTNNSLIFIYLSFNTLHILFNTLLSLQSLSLRSTHSQSSVLGRSSRVRSHLVTKHYFGYFHYFFYNNFFDNLKKCNSYKMYYKV